VTEPTPDQVTALFLPRLREERDALRLASGETAEHRRPVELDQQSVGRLSRMDAIQQQAIPAAQDARRQARIRAIEAALRRTELGEFGWCDRCSLASSASRLTRQWFTASAAQPETSPAEIPEKSRLSATVISFIDD
jgi:DnaK suppressor protein